MITAAAIIYIFDNNRGYYLSLDDSTSEESEWEYEDEDWEDNQPMLIPEILTMNSRYSKEKLHDPYCQERCLNMEPNMDIWKQIHAWVGKMVDSKSTIGKNK